MPFRFTENQYAQAHDNHQLDNLLDLHPLMSGMLTNSMHLCTANMMKSIYDKTEELVQLLGSEAAVANDIRSRGTNIATSTIHRLRKGRDPRYSTTQAIDSLYYELIYSRENARLRARAEAVEAALERSA